MDRAINGVEARRESTETLDVPRGACRRVRCAQGGVVGVLEGRVLLTVEGDAQDYWLAPGEALPFAPGERVWIGGWDEAVRCEVRSERLGPGSGGGVARLARWTAMAARWCVMLRWARWAPRCAKSPRRSGWGAQRG
ncbi:DUF2917 domain-containing protein [Paraburkholderia sp.]|uniref:DUF2917 domain-containing protein n=1 Tax=Paraburkholderia sp. TaxID=1926495 RepID=UPI00286EFD0C|nr:DUF2917 domain-containing protein [Paraburkholderia sp.]